MNGIEILVINRFKETLKNSYLFLFVEKIIVEKHFSWLNLSIIGNRTKYFLKGEGRIKPIGCKRYYDIRILFSPLLGRRFEKICITNPKIDYNPKIHMYKNNSLCLYYPNDYLEHVPLYKSLAWTSEWLVKYEFFEKYRVWIGNEYKH